MARRTDAQGRTAKRGQESAFPDPSYCSPLCVCASSRCRSSRCAPETLQRSAIRGFAKLLECPFPDLPDPFPRHAHQRPDLLERHGLAAFFEAVVEIEDLALTRREILLED